MKKYCIIVPILLITLLVVTSCSKKNEQNSNKQKTQSQEQQTQANQLPRWNENFEQADLNDLEAGHQVLVMGTENSDGSISADQIMIGNEKEDFENITRPMRPPIGSEDDNQNNNQLTQPPAGFSEKGPNFDRFQNMSEEDRAEFMEEMRAQREASGNIRFRNMRNSVTILRGEVIAKDESTITLKLEGGGSRLIFYSDETRVLKIKN